jgi:acyl-CoA thioesterase
MSPLIVKYAGTTADDEGRRTSKYWMKTKTARQHQAAFQKVSILLVAIGPPLTRSQCILAYISDTHLYATLEYRLPCFLIVALL